MFEKVNKYVLLILCVLLGGASVILGGRTTTLGQIVLSLWIFPALISAMRIVVFFVDRYPVLSEKVSQLSESTYFVFAFHGVILSYILSALWKLFRVKTDVGLIDSTYIADQPLNGIVCYLLTPCLAIAISIICYWIIKIIFKKRSWPLTGK